MSTWLPLDRGDGVDLVVPMEWGDANALSDDNVRRTVRSIAPEVFVDTRLRFPMPNDGATLLVACDASSHWVYGGVDVALVSGTYSVSTADHDAGRAWLRVHRLAQVTAG